LSGNATWNQRGSAHIAVDGTYVYIYCLYPHDQLLRLPPTCLLA